MDFHFYFWGSKSLGHFCRFFNFRSGGGGGDFFFFFFASAPKVSKNEQSCLVRLLTCCSCSLLLPPELLELRDDKVGALIEECLNLRLGAGEEQRLYVAIGEGVPVDQFVQGFVLGRLG